jgi:tRNA-Thr(GGU) m(6)t(6)A37 methyltransferase TsaA
MGNQSQHRTVIEKITVLLPYWVNHNNDHIRDQEKWLKKAEKEGLIEVTDELKKAIDHLRKANHHIEQANLCLKSEKAVDREKLINEGKSPIPSGQETFEQGIVNFSLKQIGVIRTPYTDNAPYQPLADDEGDFRIVVNSQYSDGLSELGRFHYIFVLYFLHRVSKKISMTVCPPWTPGREVGVFASRSPVRPNCLGLSIVRIKHIAGNQIVTSGLDVFDGTPLLDIKPYIKELDSKSDANFGWLEDLDDRDHLMLHIKGIPHDY